jgi:Protein of unknown function (DUF3611)
MPPMPRELKTKDDNESAKPSSGGDSNSVSPNVLRVVIAFRRWGWFAFWVQVVLGVISTVILLTLAFYRPNPAAGNALPVGLDTNPATLPGLGFTWVGLAILGASILWNFRYTRLANKLRTPERPTKSQTLFQLKIGVVVNLVGMFLTLLGAGAIVGTLAIRAQQGNFSAVGGFSQTIQPIDLQIIQASFNVVFAHFVGLTSSLWLMQRTTDKPTRE